MKIEWIKSVRSIVTILLVLTYCWLCIKGVMEARELQTLIGMVIVFYFAGKHRNGGSDATISNSSN